MTRSHRPTMKVSPLLLLPLFVLPLSGCGSSTDAPPAMPPHNDPPRTTPKTADDKIKAIENSGVPEDQKKAAIERVKSGKL